MTNSSHSQGHANSDLNPVALDVACEAAAKASGIPGSTVQFLNSNNQADVHSLALLFADVFMECEPVIQTLTPSDEEQRENFRLTCEKKFTLLASSGTTLLARTADSTIIAGIIAGPWRKRDRPYPAPAGLEPMYALLDRLDGEFARHLANRADPERKTFDLLFGAVHRDFEGLSIIADLIWIALLYARHHGYEEAIVKATSRSQRTLQRGGF